MNGSAADSESLYSEAAEIRETFLESYSRGYVDVCGFYAPDYVTSEVPPELVCGDFRPPGPPDEVQRVRELYTPELHPESPANIPQRIIE